jgi:hypothetical protein
MPPYYKNGINDGSSESHSRNKGNKDRFSSLTDGYEPSKNGHQCKGNERRNASKIICPSQKDIGQDGLPAKVNGCLSSKGGGKSRGNEVSGGASRRP